MFYIFQSFSVYIYVFTRILRIKLKYKYQSTFSMKTLRLFWFELSVHNLKYDVWVKSRLQGFFLQFYRPSRLQTSYHYKNQCNSTRLSFCLSALRWPNYNKFLNWDWNFDNNRFFSFYHCPVVKHWIKTHDILSPWFASQQLKSGFPNGVREAVNYSTTIFQQGIREKS